MRGEDGGITTQTSLPVLNDTNEAKKLDVKEIYSRNKKRRGRSKYLLSVPITITISLSQKGD